MKSGNVWELKWEVQLGGYEWIQTLSGLALVPKADGRAAGTRRYSLLSKEHSGLFRTFAALDRDTESVLRFANSYGLLGTPVVRVFYHDVAQGKGPFVEADLYDFYPSPADYYSEDFHDREDPYGFRGELFDGETAGEEHNPGDWCWSRQIERMQIFLHNPSHLDIVNDSLAATVPPLLEPVGVNAVQLRLSPRSLVGALWLQAALAVADKKTFRRCAKCPRLIEISTSGGARADAMFCSNACKSRDYRDRVSKARRLARRGWSAVQIAKKVRSDPATIRKWLR